MQHNNETLSREKGSIYSLVTKYYIFFAVIVLVMAFLIITISERVLENISVIPDVSKITDQMTLLENERYDRLRVEKYIGTKGYIEVLDKNANIIYSSNAAKANSYNPDELKYIPRATGGTYYYVDDIVGDNELLGYAIHKYSYVDDFSSEEPDVHYGLIEVDILDKNRNILYSTEGEDGRITERELSYISGGDDENTYMQIFDFSNTAGETRHLIFHVDYSNSSLNHDFRTIYMTAILTFLFLFAFLVIVFVFRTAVSVRRPMTMLQDAMSELGKGDKDVAISYSGPKEFVQIVDSFNDMSERLRKSEEERKQLENERQKMLADISHDLKTPITVIQGYSRAVSDGMVPEEEQKKYLDTITRKADNLSELINTFYEYSKLEHPEYQIIKSNEDICEYYREYLASKYEELDIAGYPLEIDIPEEKIARPFDPAQLKRVFENIISNSIKSNPAGTTIYAGMKQASNKVAIYLGDNGVGIPDAIRDEVFKPFVVGDDARTSGSGTGLGLSIAKLIVEAHGGTIRLMDSSETEYTTMFEIII